MAQATPVPQPNSPAPTSEATPAAKPVEPAVKKPVETPEKPVKEKGKMKGLYILIILMAILSLGLVSYIVYTEIFQEDNIVTTDDSDSDTEEQDTDTDLDIEEVEEGEETTEDFTGDYLGAEVPLGWSIVEYEDGDGTDMVTEGVNFTGLTGVEILNGDEDMVYKFYAVYGIGGVDACDEYYQFEDYSEDDYNDIVTSSVGFGMDTELIDYTDVDYTEFTFLGLRIRRVEKMLFQDIVDGETYFEPACNISYGVWNLEDLAFNDGTMDSSAYMWEIADDATDEELLLLDDILSSVEAT